MKEAKYFRMGRVIRTPDGDEVFPSINKAKKRSHAIQMQADKAIGRGTLRVVDKLPTAQEAA